MNIIHALILGIIQGLTEFLPISSSGHLVGIPYIFNWNYQGVAFDVALHAGTALAIILFFWNDWIAIIKKAFSKNARIEGRIKKYPDNILWQILVASVPAGIIGILLDKIVEQKFHFIPLLALNFIIFGILLWYADRKSQSNSVPGELTYKTTFIIGLFQSIALIPGVSRSGITLTGSRFLGIPREEAARFSFLLATPAIVGACILKIPDMKGEAAGFPFWLAIAVATISGVLAIQFLLNYLKKSDFSLFMWYRIAFGILLLGIYFLR